MEQMKAILSELNYLAVQINNSEGDILHYYAARLKEFRELLEVRGLSTEYSDEFEKWMVWL